MGKVQDRVKELELATLAEKAESLAKDQALSKLRQEQRKTLEENNRLSDQLSLRHKAPTNSRVKELERDLQRALTLFPDVDNVTQLEEAVRTLQRTEKNANDLAVASVASLSDWEQVAQILCPDQPYAFEAANRAANLISALAAATEKANMSPATGSGMLQDNLSPETCQTLWNQLPEYFRQLRGQPAPSTSEELMTALAHITPRRTVCQHPEELAETLRRPRDQDWEESRGEVLTMMETPQTIHVSRTPEQRLFRVSDVPVFSDRKKYSAFRVALSSFLSSADEPAPHDYVRALRRILGTFTDDVALDAAQGWDVTPQIQDTWKETYVAFIQALDLKFESPTILEDTKKDWLRCRPQNDESAPDFFTRFEAINTKYLAVKARAGIRHSPEVNQSAATERILAVMPKYLTDHIKDKLLDKGLQIEDQTVEQLRPQYARAWMLVPKQAAPPKDTNKSYIHARAVTTGTDPSKTPILSAKKCGNIVSYDTHPPVPQHLRGSLYPNPRNPADDTANAARRLACATQQLCTFCRRDRSQHQAVGTNFKAVTMPPTTGSFSRAATTAPLPVARQLEAPPTTVQTEPNLI